MNWTTFSAILETCLGNKPHFNYYLHSKLNNCPRRKKSNHHLSLKSPLAAHLPTPHHHGVESELLPIHRQLRQEILFARERVYRFATATPLEKLAMPSGSPEVWIKREDLSLVKSYKWRGACNRMATLTKEQAVHGVVTASAGNHAQGVALAAQALAIRARIYMPRSTPRIKQAAVLRHGGEWVEIHLAGDSYDEAVTAALQDQQQSRATYIHAYDDLQVMAGQGTLADEVVLSGHGPFDAAFLQIGGGGMAAGVSCWLKTYWPAIECIGVEGVEQASMLAAFSNGGPVTLDQVDLFCDGTAVKRSGQHPFLICRETLSRIVTVTNPEVAHAIRFLWENHRCIAEPSGAMGLAALLQEAKQWTGKRVLIILCGANLDFSQLGHIAQFHQARPSHEVTLRVKICEQPGAMLELLDRCFGRLNLIDFQYGMSDPSVAWPTFTALAEHAEHLLELRQALNSHGYEYEELCEAQDVAFRAIPLRGDYLRCPLFLRLDFYERPGALHDFLAKRLYGNANLCYFNYRQSGERIGRALIGLDFPSPWERDAFMIALPERGDGYRHCQVLDQATQSRLLAGVWSK